MVSILQIYIYLFIFNSSPWISPAQMLNKWSQVQWSQEEHTWHRLYCDSTGINVHEKGFLHW